MAKFRKGFQENTDSGGKRGGSFAPDLRWRGDNDEKFILMLIPQDDVVRVKIHEWIEVGKAEKANGDTYTKFETFISRRDPNIGENSDILEDKFNLYPKDRHMGVAVELEPVMETIRGRHRPKSFQVKTETYKTQEGERVQPAIGILTQGNKNFWGWVQSYDNAHAPINEVPVAVTRRGTDKDTTYDFVPFADLSVDLSPLFDNLDGISYLRDEMEDIKKGVADANDEIDQAAVVGNALLDKRLDELADKERYDNLVGGITDYKPRFPQEPRKVVANGKASPPVEATEEVSTDRRERFAALRQSVEN